MTRKTFLQISALALTALGLSSAPIVHVPKLVRFAIQTKHYCYHKTGAFWNGCLKERPRLFAREWPLQIVSVDWNALDSDLIPGHVTFTWEDGRTEKVRALVKRSEPQKIFALEV